MSRPDIKTAKWETRNLADLTNWENNPRSILKEDFERLKGQIEELGVHNGLLINQDNIVLGGNMRLRAFQELNKRYNLDQITCRVVETKDEGEMLKYALSDNDQMGITDDLKLAEVFSLHPIETRLYKIQANTLRPLESIINPPDPTTLGGDGGVDQSGMDESLDTYMNGNIKQIVLYYDNEAYGQVVEMLNELSKLWGIENNTEIATRAIKEAYERDTAQKEAN